MSGEYRDELAAAHARIAELEEKVRVLAEEVNAAPRPLEGHFPELEAEVVRLRKVAEPAASARRRERLTILGALLPLVGMLLMAFHYPVAATVCSVLFMLTIFMSTVVLTNRQKTNMRRLKDAEAKLLDARRIAELEAALAGTKLRVAPPEAEAVEEEEPDLERTARRH